MAKMKDGKRAFVATIGTGDSRDPEGSLYAPILLSFRGSGCTRAVLLPSRGTLKNAEAIARILREGGAEVDVTALARDGMEEDADACFASYTTVLQGLLDGGWEPVPDFTRGTKAMSAALVLAAARLDIPEVRYVGSPERDERGSVVKGSEVVRRVRTDAVGYMRTLDCARQLFHRGAFSSVLDLLPEPAGKNPFAELRPAWVREAAGALRRAAAFGAAWDRFDYGAAVAIPPTGRGMPTEEQHAWVSGLDAPPPAALPARVEPLRRLAADLLANGQRRVAEGKYEDALLRAYRIAELMGQVRLFARGMDPSSLDPGAPAVRELQKRGGPRGGGRVKAGREQVVDLLGILKDPFAKELGLLGRGGFIPVSERNDSVLVHGFRSVGSRASERMPALYGKLEDLLRKEAGAPMGPWLEAARSLASPPAPPEGGPGRER